MLSLFDKLKEIVEQRFDIKTEVFPADHWSHQTIRAEIVTLEPNEIERSEHLSCHVYTYRDSDNRRHVITLRGNESDFERHKNDIKNLIETLYIEPMFLLSRKNWVSQHLEMIEERVSHQRAIQRENQSSFEEAHVALIGNEFDNLKMAIEMHEKSGRWAFIKIEKQQDLEFFKSSDAPVEGATVYISQSVIDDELTLPLLKESLAQSPTQETNWIILSATHFIDISSVQSPHLYIHQRQQMNLQVVRPKNETLH